MCLQRLRTRLCSPPARWAQGRASSSKGKPRSFPEHTPLSRSKEGREHPLCLLLESPVDHSDLNQAGKGILGVPVLA